MTKLNIGCGQSKIDGCINIDSEESCKPDLVHDILKGPLPFEKDSVQEVYLFHTIEHIRKCYHRAILWDIRRVLEPNGRLLVSYPEFKKCYRNWEINKNDQKQFWEATIFGRQLYPSDHHVCIMDSVDFHGVLNEIGFKDIVVKPEPTPNEYNTIISARKGKALAKYEDILEQDISLLQLI